MTAAVLLAALAIVTVVAFIVAPLLVSLLGRER